MPDPRARRGKRHTLAGLLAIGVAAVLAGARSFAAIGEFAAAHPAALPGDDAAGRAPDESTFRRVFARVDGDALASVIGAWLWTRTAVVAGRRVISLDGKTIRGARRGEQPAPHLVAALDHASGTVLGQLRSRPRATKSLPYEHFWQALTWPGSWSPSMRCTPSTPLPA